LLGGKKMPVILVNKVVDENIIEKWGLRNMIIKM
jgi:hypothetical protein